MTTGTTNVTTKVEWASKTGDQIDAIYTKITDMVSKGKQISSNSTVVNGHDIITSVWKDTATANEYLTFINALSPAPVSAAII